MSLKKYLAVIGAFIFIAFALVYWQRSASGIVNKNYNPENRSNRSVDKLQTNSSIVSIAPGSHGSQDARNRLEMDSLDYKINQLPQKNRPKIVKALRTYFDYLKDLEYECSTLRWNGIFEDKTVRLYEVNSPSKLQLSEAQREIDRIIADNRFGILERRTFSQYATESLASLVVPKEEVGSLFFLIPHDQAKSILVNYDQGSLNLDNSVKELSLGMQTKSLNISFGAGDTRILSQTKKNWRYSNFLMIKSE